MTNGIFDVLSDNDLIEILKVSPDTQTFCESVIKTSNEIIGFDNSAIIISSI